MSKRKPGFIDYERDPVFCLTSDVDWAPDALVSDMLLAFREFGVKPTVFATHASPVLAAASARGDIELGVHPNFFSGSSHGADYPTVIETVMKIVPGAKAWRSHGFYDASRIAVLMHKAGIRWGSNLCCAYQSRLVPLAHYSGIVQYPVFWEDDVHATVAGEDWDVERFLPMFLEPGLKVISAHPSWFALNLRSLDDYQRMAGSIAGLDESGIETFRRVRDGARTFVLGLVRGILDRGYAFHTLEEIHARSHSPVRPLPSAAAIR